MPEFSGKVNPTLGSAPTQGTDPSNPWARVNDQDPGEDGGVDFELRFREQFPFNFSEGLPHAIVSSISEG